MKKTEQVKRLANLFIETQLYFLELVEESRTDEKSKLFNHTYLSELKKFTEINMAWLCREIENDEELKKLAQETLQEIKEFNWTKQKQTPSTYRGNLKKFLRLKNKILIELMKDWD